MTNGSGLGTMITKSIVGLHDGGGISVFSEGKGRGSTFTLQLSLVCPSDPGSAGMAEKESSRGGSEALYSTFADIENHRSFRGEDFNDLSVDQKFLDDGRNVLDDNHPVARGLHFLVVDDSLLNRKMMCKLLRAAKHSCSEAVDGVDALKKATHNFATLTNSGKTVHMYDAILMDFMMPNMDGPTATKAIRELGYKGVIIGVTGNALPSDIAHFIAHGADTVLVKPLNIPLLLSTLSNLRVAVNIPNPTFDSKEAQEEV